MLISSNAIFLNLLVSFWRDRIPNNLSYGYVTIALSAPVAQLDRAPGFEPVGRGFKSLRARQFLVDSRDLSSAVDRQSTGWFTASQSWRTPTCAPVAQLDRASASGAEGRRFDSCRARHPCSRRCRVSDGWQVRRTPKFATTQRRTIDCRRRCGPLAQLAEQQTLNLRVPGSIPGRLTTFSGEKRRF